MILLLDFVLSVNKYLKQWCLFDGSIMGFIVKTVLLLLCIFSTFVLLFCFFLLLFCFCSAFVLFCSAFVLLFCFCSAFGFWLLGFWILAFLMTWLLFLHHKNIISFSKYSIVRLTFVDLRWAQLYVSLVSYMPTCYIATTISNVIHFDIFWSSALSPLDSEWWYQWV